MPAVPSTGNNFVIAITNHAVLIINTRFLGLCQVHKGMHRGVGVGGFGCGKDCWEEARARVHERALKIRAS